jgi:putative MFS transporter
VKQDVPQNVGSEPSFTADDATRRWTITLAASLGWFFDAYVITIYALTVPLIATDFKTDTTVLSGLVGSIFLVGYTIGTIGFGICGDRFGRRSSLGVSIIGYGVATALTAFVNGVGSLGFLRFLTGVGGGGELSIGSPYVSEVWGRKRRGIGIGIMFAFYPLGYLFSIGVFKFVAANWGWRAVYLFSLVPALSIIMLRMRLEESPRYIAVVEGLKRTQSHRVSLSSALYDVTFRFRVCVGFLIFTSLTYSFYSMAFFMPAYVVKHYNVSATSGATVVAAFFESGGLVGALIGGYFGDLFGRRRPAMIGAIAGMFIIYSWWGFSWDFSFFCIFAAIGGFIINFQWSLGVVYVNELFPTEIRATGFGVSAGLGRVVSIAAPIVTQTLSASIGIADAIKLSSVIWVPLIIGYYISAETKGEELADLLQRPTKMENQDASSLV